MLSMNKVDKFFDNIHAINNISLTIEEGELFGFVGPNGAGKTTILKLLAGLLKPDSGTIAFNKENLTKTTKKRMRSSYMPDYFGVYENLKVKEYMEFFARIYGGSAAKRKEKIEQLLWHVHLEEKQNDYVDKLSKGMKQKLSLARCMIYDPEIILMDEPFAGLDAIGRIEFMKLLTQVQRLGKTIVISSHMLAELEKVCSSLAILNDGHIIMKGTMGEIMKQKIMSNPIRIKVQDSIEQAIHVLHQNKKITSITKQKMMLFVTFQGNEDDEAQILRELIQNNIRVSSFSREESNLETVFLSITGERKEDM